MGALEPVVMKVYSLLSLGRREIARLLPGAVAAPPIERDCLRRDVLEGIDVVAIVDGVFEQARAVTPGEIVDAMRAGLRVHGSSSMGALRAAELARFGMVGHGKIFERIARSKVYRDDFLAQTFTVVGGEPRPLTVPYADFEAGLERCVNVTRDDRRLLLSLYASLFYGDRHRAALVGLLRRRRATRLIPTVEQVFGLRKTQKSLDAESMLRALRRDLSRVRRANRRLHDGWRRVCF